MDIDIYVCVCVCVCVYTHTAGNSDGRKSPWNVGDCGLIPGSGRSPREGNGNPLQYSCLENSVDRGAWWATYSPWCHKDSDTTERLHFHFVMPRASLIAQLVKNLPAIQEIPV